MKKIVISLFITLFFIGCGKYEPKLPQSYDDVNFVELMELLDTKKKVEGVYWSKWFKNSNDITKYMIEPFKNLCFKENGVIKSNGHYVYKDFRYCSSNNKILFGYWIKKDNIYSKFMFNGNSDALTKEFKAQEEKYNKYLINKKIEEEKRDRNAHNILQKINKIRGTKSQNSFLSNYVDNNFREIDDIYYFTFIKDISKKQDTITIDFDGEFLLNKMKSVTRENFTNKVINEITEKYKINLSRDIDLLKSNLEFKTGYNHYTRSTSFIKFKSDMVSDINNLDVIIGIRHINNPSISKKCNTRKFTQIYNINEEDIKKYRNASCTKSFSYDGSIHNFIVYDKKLKKIVFYAEKSK